MDNPAKPVDLGVALTETIVLADNPPTSRVTLDSIVDSGLGVSDVPDDRTTAELKHWQAESARAEVQAALQNIDERKKYAERIFWLVALWLAAMVYVVVCQGYAVKWFDLHDSVLIALITTTTGGVVGVLVLVVKYLFPSKN